MSPISFFQRHPRADLSAYLDGEMAANAVERIEAHVASCAACAAHLTELRETRAALRALPEAQAPRSFALTPEMVRETPIAPRPDRRIQPLVNSLRLTSVGLAIALAAVLLLDVSGGGSSSSSSPSAISLVQGQDSYSQALPSASTADRQENLPAVAPSPSDADKGPHTDGDENLGRASSGSDGAGVGGVGSAGVGGPPGAGATQSAGSEPDLVSTPASSPLAIPSDNAFQDRDDANGGVAATESPKAVVGNIGGSSTPVPEAQSVTSQGGGSGGTDTLTIVAIALGVLLAAALIGSIAASRLAREAP